MAPVAMMAPCPGMRRGTEPMVPTVPGLVSEMRGAFEIRHGQFIAASACDDVVISG